jgi:hypothetical protein
MSRLSPLPNGLGFMVMSSWPIGSWRASGNRSGLFRRCSIARVLRIRAVEALRRHRLRLTLTNGDVVERDVGAALWGPVFEPVRSDPSVFRAVRVRRGAIEWPGGVDLDPDVLIWEGPPPTDPNARPSRRLQLRPRATASEERD